MNAPKLKTMLIGMLAAANAVANAAKARCLGRFLLRLTPALLGTGLALDAAANSGVRVGEKFRDCTECPEMAVLPSRTYRMGAPESEAGSSNRERPVHGVTIGAPFALGVYEVTFAEWDACVAAGGCGGRRPDDRGWGRGSRPVIHMSWGDAKGYVRWLTYRTGKRYRLPSESEWEYAARAGTDTAYSWGDGIGENLANCDGCGSQWDGARTAPAGSFAANGWGLHDMHGNVWEWTRDCWHGSYAGAPSNGSAWLSDRCLEIVVRGGSWNTRTRDLRAAYRHRGVAFTASGSPRILRDTFGFRVARTLAANEVAGRVPAVRTPIPTQSLFVGRDGTLDLSRHFVDDQRLAYRARSSNAAVLRVSVVAHVLTLVPVSVGSATVTATVRDLDGNEASQTFTVMVDVVKRRVGEKFRECAECPEMVVVPSRTYRMGAPESEAGSSDQERPVHGVTIGAPFALGVYEVTFAEWDACVAAGGCGGHRPDDEGWGRGSRPVIHVSWDDAKRYVQWLSGKTGKAYRLPSESEWEYAARAGTDTAYSWGNGIGKNLANCDGCGSQWDDARTAPAGSFAANRWGLHDMHGNVWEWAEDCWNRSYAGAPSDGSAWLSGGCLVRVLRGGSWDMRPRYLRVAYRNMGTAGLGYDIFGFRVARTLAANEMTGRVPAVRTPIPAQPLVVGRDGTLDLSRHFVDDQRLAYEARSSDAAVLRVSLVARVLTLVPVSVGSATVTATARDPDGNEVSQTFTVRVGASPVVGRRVGEKFRDCTECPQMAVLPSRTYRMGAPESEAGSSNQERPVHGVTIRAPFALGVYEVTFAEWDACVAAGGCRRLEDKGWGRGSRPVIHMSRGDAQRYVQWLSRRTGKRYRLPSESEWEYAARAGTDTAYSWGDGIGENLANCDGCGSQWDGARTAPAGSFAANGWGLHDMHGNVWEWTEDCWHGSYAGAPSNGSAWVSGRCFERVLRGGSWDTRTQDLRAAYRHRGDAYTATGSLRNLRDTFGFRVARTLAANEVAGRVPTAGTPIPAQSLVAGRDGALDLSGHFVDDQSLVYRARSSNAAVLRVSVAGSVLRLVPVSAGRATVTATARDPDGNEASQTFTVTVSASPDGGGQGGRKFRDCTECPQMAVVPSGTYRMGAPESEAGSSNQERPVHGVTIAAPFALGVYEVTFAEWDACVAAGGCGGHRPDDEGWGRGSRPVIHVSWDDAKRYVQWLSGKTGKSYRLPSESEWEYAARAGADTAYSWGDGIGENLANCDGCGSQWDDARTAPAGSFAANRWGLHDMHGNVWEWAEDCWNRSYAGAPSDGSAWLSGGCLVRVLRGGSWDMRPRYLRVAYRNMGTAGLGYNIFGFRVARTLAANEMAGRVPAAGTSIPAQSLVAGRDGTLDLSEHFVDDQRLAYEAHSSDADLVRVSVTDSVLTLMPVSEGSATTTATAHDPDGNEASQTFTVTVGTGTGGSSGTDRTIPEQSLVVGRDVTLDLSEHFVDDQRLAYEAHSSDADLVRVSVTDSVLTLMPVSAGSATVTATARDPDGNEASQTFTVTVGAGTGMSP